MCDLPALIILHINEILSEHVYHWSLQIDQVSLIYNEYKLCK